jgi:hypothetical protein
MCEHINPTSHSSPLIVVIISTQNKVVNKGHVEVYRTSVDELLLFHQLKRNFNHSDKFYLKAQEFPRFSMHECNAHFCVLSIFSLTSWDVTITLIRAIGRNCLILSAPFTFEISEIIPKLRRAMSTLPRAKSLRRFRIGPFKIP